MIPLSLEDRLESLNECFGNRLNGEYDNEKVSEMSSSILSTLGIEGKENKNFSVSIVNNTKENFFGIRIFPSADELDNITKDLIINHGDQAEFELEWKKIQNWMVEIDSNCFDNMCITFAPEEITAFLLFEITNVVYTTDVPNIIYNAYINSYMQQNYFSRKGMEILYLLYEVAFIQTCVCKNWILEKNNPDRISENAYDVKILNQYKDPVLSGIVKVIRAFGNLIIEDDLEKFRKADQLINWANKFAFDYVKRKNELKDDLLLKAYSTSSIYMRTLYIRILNTIGIELRERYSGAAIESITADIFDIDNFMKKYSANFNIKNKMGVLIESRIRNIENNNRIALEGIFGNKAPLLPKDRDIDMIFVDIDRMENQFDRKYVLDRIYRLMDKIVIFEQYYSSDENTLLSMKYEIDRQKKLLNEARDRVLSKRSFDKTYKVFVKVPEGYEG